MLVTKNPLGPNINPRGPNVNVKHKQVEYSENIGLKKQPALLSSVRDSTGIKTIFKDGLVWYEVVWNKVPCPIGSKVSVSSSRIERYTSLVSGSDTIPEHRLIKVAMSPTHQDKGQKAKQTKVTRLKVT